MRVTVVDTGSGIDPEVLPHIFERLYWEKGGTDLSLSIAQWIAQAHGGRIEVTSELGKGSVFTLWLPTMVEKEKISSLPLPPNVQAAISTT